ncbi:MAG: 3-dehydroquinate synthase [Chloroflexi bacterium]|nr:3-dehydroquinate synthase [Chloroflexota bacterium]
MLQHIFLYGPPGSGKSTIGRLLAQALDLPFIDLDTEITRTTGRSIPRIFATEGEGRFRRIEAESLRKAVQNSPSAIALGGGALLNPEARALAEEHGRVVCLNVSFPELQARIQHGSSRRPLLEGSDPVEQLRGLMAVRAAHYGSFPLRLDTDGKLPAETVWEAQKLLGRFRVRGMGAAYDAIAESGGLAGVGLALRQRGLKGPLALVTDGNVGPIYLADVEKSLLAAGYEVHSEVIKPGEASKTIDTVIKVWSGFIEAGLDRGSTVIALGGGVVGDLAGFAAATYLRGVKWVNLPTTILAMVDSSLGGKTGVDLPQAKNLVGAFHAPVLTLADPDTLATLPERELRSGLAEVVKHGIIADPDLFALCARGWNDVTAQMGRIVRQAMAVKVQVIEADPFEQGARQSLNLGHTVGHGVERASGFRLSHGECVAIGMVVEAQLAEAIGLAEPGLVDTIRSTLAGLGLPVEIPEDLPRDQIVAAMGFDKKRSAGQVRFALPVHIGEVRTGVEVAGWQDIIMGL